MANLQNQNVALNYKGIINLDATTINTPLDATLRAVTDGMGTSSLLNLSTEQVGVLRTVNLAAGATNPSLFNVAYTINNSGAQTGTLRGIFLNATETALNGITHNLMDLQVGGSSLFRVKNNGQIVGNSTFGILFGSSSNITAPSNGNILLTNNAGTDFARLQFGGLTNAFPAIKRSGAAIDFRLADDSGFCAVNTGVLSIQNTVAAAVAVASTHKVTIAIGGTTYYLLASNV
jgi:hypothetical protein